MLELVNKLGLQIDNFFENNKEHKLLFQETTFYEREAFNRRFCGFCLLLKVILIIIFLKNSINIFLFK